MSGLNFFSSVNKVCGLLTVCLFLCLPFASQAQAADVVTTYKDENGWKLQVNGEDYYMKGVVWGYTPRGENYTYNLFGQSDDFIRKVLDYEFGLMAKMGVNSIRSFTMIPPEWVTYIYREHGIMSVINPLMGRYGYNVGGKWIPFTDYSDPLTRETLKRDMLEFVMRYKDVPGVLMFAFGNESNYGLSWSSFEIENLPEGEQNTAKARFLYSLWNEVTEAGKAVDPNHPFTIVNGDIQYIDLIAELIPNLDLLGTNAYRGTSFTGLWADVKEKLDIPIVFFEFGSDAFNARDFQEDQLSQALILKDQWQEMYNKAATNGEEGNSIGAFVFEWRDEWWKYLQIENLDVQDNNASWSNQAYLFDWAEGKNNMNEEWFGIAALGPANSDGVATARPRMAYDVLAEVFQMDPYSTSKSEINQTFANLDLDYYALKGDVRLLKAEVNEDKNKLNFTGGYINAEMVLKGTEIDITEDGENGIEWSDGQMAFLDFGFQPSARVNGQFTLNILGNVADTEPLEIRYGRRGLPIPFVGIGTNPDSGEEELVIGETNDRERIEIYDFEATYEGESFDINAFYHTRRFHWGYEGDFFGLIRESTDLEGMDIWNAKAPEGVEITGKGKWDGLTLLFGPEVYWGANPKVVFKYDFKLAKFDWTFIHSEDVARQGESTSATGATERQSRQTTLFAEREFAKGWKLELGAIMSATEKVDDIFDRYADGDVYLDEIEFEDTLGFKAKLTFPVFGKETYLQATHAGLVADGGAVHRTFGVMDPSRLPYSGLGNKQEFEAGMILGFGNLMIYPRVMYRDNLVHANPFIEPSIGGGVLNPGVNPRDRDNDPFAVLGNREARSAEVYFTWDPTGATQFYDWDNEWREDAKFAFNFGATYTEFPTTTDANLFFSPFFETNASFGVGLPAEEVWTVSSRMAFNPNPNAKYFVSLMRGFDQSTGDPSGGTRDYFELHGKAVLGRKHTISGYFMKDAWGPYDFHRQFNVTYPEQYKLDYSILLGSGGAGSLGNVADENRASRIGIRTLYRTNDPNDISAPEAPGSGTATDAQGDYIFQTVLYFTYQF